MAKQKNNTASDYKSSPFGLIPKDWAIEELSNVFEYINTPSFSRDNLTNEKTKNELYYIHYGDIHATYKTELLNFDIETKVPFLKDEFYSDNFNFLKDGDLVIADASEDYEGVGECIEIKNIRDKKVIGGLHTIVIRDNSKKTIDGFRTYIFRNSNIHNELKKIATGTSVYGVSKGNLSKIKLPLPPLPEQKAIAKLLSAWDKAIQNSIQLIAKKEERKKWLMQQLLTGKKRIKGFEKETWVEERLGDITKLISRRNKDIVDAKVYSVTNSNGFVLQSEHFSREIAGNDLSNYKIIKKYEFAYNPARINVGSIAYFENEIGIISSLYVCFSTTKDIEDYFLKEVLKLDHTKHKIGAYGEGGVRIYLWYDLFKKIKILLPGIEAQKSICEVLKKAETEIQFHQKKLKLLKEQKKGLMKLLLTGKKRLKIK
jgi:type I restriction enzyme S subunit